MKKDNNKLKRGIIMINRLLWKKRKCVCMEGCRWVCVCGCGWFINTINRVLEIKPFLWFRWLKGQYLQIEALFKVLIDNTNLTYHPFNSYTYHFVVCIHQIKHNFIWVFSFLSLYAFKLSNNLYRLIVSVIPLNF